MVLLIVNFSSLQVMATLPDGSPAALEPMEVCLYSVCKNFTTDSEGVLLFAVPPHLEGNPVVRLNLLFYEIT